LSRSSHPEEQIANGGIGDLIEEEMLGAAKAIEGAMQRLQQLMARPRDTGRSSAVDLQVHDSILRWLSAALEICNRNNWVEGLSTLRGIGVRDEPAHRESESRRPTACFLVLTRSNNSS